jgi:hypothetical protein
MKKLTVICLTALSLGLSGIAAADSVSLVVECKLKEGKTREEAQALNGKWLKWARSVAGTDEITSAYAVQQVGDFGSFSWVDTYPDLIAWAKVAEADLEEDDPELDAAFDDLADCSSSRLWRVDPTAAAK